MADPLKKDKESEEEVHIFLDMVIRASLLFKQCVRLYLEQRGDEFENRLDLLTKLEGKADVQLRSVEGLLFGQTAMEGRGDILGLMEATDNVVNLMDQTIRQFIWEKPTIPPDLHSHYISLAEISSRAVERTVAAIRSYFRDPQRVRETIGRVMQDKNKASDTAETLKRHIFRSAIALDRKMHMRSFADHIEDVAEAAEDVCDLLAIATIKRFTP